MDFYDDNFSGNYGVSRSETGFGLASAIVGLFSVITCCTGVTCIPLGALGILFALLSRKEDRRFPSSAFVGLIASVLGLCIGGCLILYCSFRILFDSDFRSNYVDPLYKQLYGIDFEEFLQQYFQLLNS